MLNQYAPFADETHNVTKARFQVERSDKNPKIFEVKDQLRNIKAHLPEVCLEDSKFDLKQWYEYQIAVYELERHERTDISRLRDSEIPASEETWVKLKGLVSRLLQSKKKKLLGDFMSTALADQLSLNSPLHYNWPSRLLL